MPKYSDEIIMIVDGGTTAALASMVDAMEISRTARLASPIVMDRIIAVVDRYRESHEDMKKIMVLIDREMRHPKEQTAPRSPKARFRKGR